MSTRKRKCLSVVPALLGASSLAVAAADSNQVRVLSVPMTNAAAMTIEGTHRFVVVAGRTGFLPTDPLTQATVSTALHGSSEGTLSLWFSPLEDLDKIRLKTQSRREYFPLAVDCPPDRGPDEAGFGVYWEGPSNYPQLIARFLRGRFWGIATRRIGPFCYLEYLPLRKGCWYHVVTTWSKPARLLELYVNGVKVGRNPSAEGLTTPADRLYLGNPHVVMRDFSLRDAVLSPEQIQTLYREGLPADEAGAREDVRRVASPSEFPPLDLVRDGSWKEAYTCSFTNKSDLDGWTFVTGPEYRSQFRLEITPEGFRWQTPDPVAYETRGYIWCPKTFGGDVWVEFDFRLESPRGLALVMIHASGMEGEDVVNGLGLPPTGRMDPMMTQYRNYHWEFIRRVDSLRDDVETQYVQKNPWDRLLHFGCVPRLEQNRWYRLRWVRAGARLHGSIDGKTVFDLKDEAAPYRGPILDTGRLALRHMYHTTVRYRNLVVYERRGL